MITVRRHGPSGSPPDEATIERGLERLREALRARGLRYSGVREAVARAALCYPGHFEVNDLVRELRNNGIKDAHTTTVYRTMPILVEAGLIGQTLLSSSERQFFERKFERPDHDHIICTSCGKVVEFEFEAFTVLQRDVARSHGFRLESRIHELLGTCHDCATRDDDPQV